MDVRSPSGGGSSGGKKKSHKDDNGLLSFFRSSSRPPSPDPDIFYNNGGHTRKTSMGHIHSSNTASNTTNSSIPHSNSSSSFSGSNAPTRPAGPPVSSSYSSYHSLQGGSSNGSMSANLYERRRSAESYSRSPSPDHHPLEQSPQLGGANGGSGVPTTAKGWPTTLSSQNPHPINNGSNARHQQQQYQQQQYQQQQQQRPMPGQRSDSRKNVNEAPQHRRTKSSDFGDLYGKRSNGQEQDQPAPVQVSPAKETKKTNNFFSRLKKKSHQSNQSSNTHADSSSARKHSADDTSGISPFSPPSIHAATSSSFILRSDSDSGHGLFFGDRRHGSSDGDSHHPLQHSPWSRKSSKKDGQPNTNESAQTYNLNMDNVTGFIDNSHGIIMMDSSAVPVLRPLGDEGPSPWPSVGGAESWAAPESWGVQPPSTVVGVKKSVAIAPDDRSSDDLSQSDYETWDFGKKKLSTIRIFRPDTTYTTVNCVPTDTTTQLSALLVRKHFKPDTSKFHIYMKRNNIVRLLGPHERPLSILRRCLLQFGYTDQDKLEELSGKDNSFLCRFMFTESDAPLTMEDYIAEHGGEFTHVNLQGKCLQTIPIFLFLKSRAIVTLDVSHNLRMDLPLDFFQGCTALRELYLIYNDLDRLPNSVRALPQLRKLDARGNRIRDLEYAQLEQAHYLETLILKSNRLSTIPDSYRHFTQLSVLDLSSNNFKKIPAALCEIMSLDRLDLSFNEISELPDELCKLTRLRTLILLSNRIGGTLPKSVEGLVRLEKLDLRQNGLIGIEAVNALTRLKELMLDYNTTLSLNSSCLQSVVRVTATKSNLMDMNLRGCGETLTMLDVSFNKLSNLGPELFEHLRSLEVLRLDFNSIGSIPSTIGLLRRLRILSISNNKLSRIPDEIQQLESLQELSVHGNNLSELPAAIWHCPLITLNASSNILEAFPDPPKISLSQQANNNSFSTLSASSSAATLLDPDSGSPLLPSSLPVANGAGSAGSGGSGGSTNGNGGGGSSGGGGGSTSPSPSRSKPLPATPSNITVSNRALCSAPMTTTLQNLYLGDNRLPDDVFFPLSQFTNLMYLNVSHNEIDEIPRGKIPNPGYITHLYLSGNRLTSLPAEDIERLRGLRVLHVNGNKLTTLPAELGKINKLNVLDVGCNMLKYNISNWPYDWNWNWNLELKYLNMSGNKKLQIKKQQLDNVPVHTRHGNLSDFGALTRLRILGLMDVTITDSVPENSVDRRVRTSMSSLHNMSYGMADTLGDSDYLSIWDLVHPKFQTKEDESLFGLFDGRSQKYQANCMVTNFLKDRFGTSLKIELEKMEGPDTVVSALRRTFLGLDRELWSVAPEDKGRGGVASALVAYIKGSTLYAANVGDAMAVLAKKSDAFQVISHKHTPWNPTEIFKIKRAGGFVSGDGLLNEELDTSRAFGGFHLVPIVNSNPYIEVVQLTEEDDFLIMASKSFWDVMSYRTAVDIAKAERREFRDLMYAAQKLRDIAISYGAREHMVVMLIGVGDLFTRRGDFTGTQGSPIGDADLQEEQARVQAKSRRAKQEEAADSMLARLEREIEAPQGEVAMVFTDIKSSTKLWENNDIAMAMAIKEHFIIMRRQLRAIGGYEVKNEGDAMMASFSSVPAAMLWCLTVQDLLLTADWPQEILDSAEGHEVFDDKKRLLYRGLSVRMGIHWGRPVSDRDAVTRRMDYYGPMVNRAARICDAADGGQICISSDVINVINHQLAEEQAGVLDEQRARHVRALRTMGFECLDLGERHLKGLETPETLYMLYSQSVSQMARMHNDKAQMDLAARSQPGGNGVVVDVVQILPQSLDAGSVQRLQHLCLRLERLASGAAGRDGGGAGAAMSEEMVQLLSVPLKDVTDQQKLTMVMASLVTRIENAFSTLYMNKTGHYADVFESLGRALETDPGYILRALQMYVSIVGRMDGSF
ncbi:cysteinyl-tRNA synthetase [Actinomortierella ambigua]|uniref:Adenylate cyclase n=1 Tax=Actinomortierella ambigua TaxID=1343610 RepID=A0A9P6Q4T9_9FUNG|nr:cysteinyl-tRNA synthetase [Actinomortierella ambigua]